MAEDNTLQVELERLRAENAALKNRATKGVSLKVSEKGGVSVYGLGRFPVTLYKEQWEKLLDMAEDIRAFIADHAAELKTKEALKDRARKRLESYLNEGGGLKAIR
jgi:cell division protein FtsB